MNEKYFGEISGGWSLSMRRTKRIVRNHSTRKDRIMFRKLLAAAVATAALAAPAAANECCTYKAVTTYETVITYVTRTESYQKNFTLYDYCNRPYVVTRTFYRDVQVPVKKIVPVTKYVKVCY